MDDMQPNGPRDPDRGEPTTAAVGAVGKQQPGAVDYDAELRLYNEVLRRACGVGPRDHVMDIGCGTGQTTRQAARLAVAGGTLGVDVSAPAIAQARRLALEEGLRNITFECADAQVHRFPDDRFDLAISRFGTMFFSDPVAAFANIGRALRPAGRLVMMVWQAKERNEWGVAIDHILAGHDGMAAVDHGAPDPFSLADPHTSTAILQAAGFADVTFTDVHQPVYYGPDVDAALAWVRGFTSTTRALKRLDPPAAGQALTRLRETLAEHLSADGVWFDSSAWIVAARRHAKGR
jgi:ubiquinone/menaquinone biosynthesis C-methylase UbiE